ncbi:MAG: hypothetical protein ABL949_15780 [Fimbriimonadaceae bacterium]
MQCGEVHEDQIIECWKCGKARGELPSPTFTSGEPLETELPRCKECNEPIEAGFDVCWKCGHRHVTLPIPTPKGPPTQVDLLEELIEGQKRQEKQLADVGEKVGCLYTYMVFGIVMGVICFIVWLLAAVTRR